MKRITYLITSLLVILMVCSIDAASAQKSKSKSKPVPTAPEPSKGKKVVVPAKAKSVAKLPAKHSTVTVKGANFFVSGGKYYRKSGVSFSLVLPPIGLRVKTLPPAPKPFRYNNVVYYVDSGAIYQQVGSEYEVVAPTVGMVVPELPEVNVAQLSIDGKIFYEYDGMLYKPVVTTEGVQYEVVGDIN
ncbi:MAG: DUF6515 family protein [Rikenellaceae bacterium]